MKCIAISVATSIIKNIQFISSLQTLLVHVFLLLRLETIFIVLGANFSQIAHSQFSHYMTLFP